MIRLWTFLWTVAWLTAAPFLFLMGVGVAIGAALVYVARRGAEAIVTRYRRLRFFL